MSAIVAVVSRAPASVREDIVRSALAAMSSRGADASRIVSCGDGTLAVTSDAWEMAASGDAALACDGDVVVVADAALYYRGDLLRALAARGERPSEPTAAHLILAAYRVWGGECARRIEGDFAFIVWDARAGRIVAARDFGATRPLFHVEAREGFYVASTVGGLLAAGADGTLDLAHLGEVASGLALDETRTCRRSIERVPAAHTMTRTRDSSPGLVRHWAPPRFETGRDLTLEDGALVLRDLLTDAVRERLDATRPTSVWLSGGWDSPAVFGAGMHATGGNVDQLRSVSITYPEGDPGCEDELITSIAQRWNTEPHWVDSRGIHLLDEVRAGATERDEPFAHVFELWNRALARGSRAVGSRIALHGNGGDQLFQVSLIYLADLVRRGRWRSVARECRARGVRDVRTLFRWALQPLVPKPALQVAAVLRGGRRLRAYLERQVPPWIDAGFAREHALHERARQVLERQPGETYGAVEGRWYMTAPYFPRVYSCVSALARDEGVEVRSPILDQRIVAFAAGRPREERASGIETKRVLRAAMRGLLPAAVLAPRRRRTGTTGNLFADALRRVGADLIAEATSRSRLADLGIVNPGALERAWREWQLGQDGNLGVALFLTLQTEFWTRAHECTQAGHESARRRRSEPTPAGVGA